MRKTTQHSICLGKRRVVYRIVHSPTALQLRVRVGPNGVEVIQPAGRPWLAGADFLRSNQQWLFRQLDRVARLGKIRRPTRNTENHILFRGVPTPVRIETVSHRRRENRVIHSNGEIVVQLGPSSRTPPAQSLETWLRREARREIDKQLSVDTAKLGRLPNRVYVMDQRTKWGNCSHKRNLSFNWRLILAPPEVLNYIVTHEVVHLAVPNHSTRFWLTVQSMCPETERAKQWLTRHGAQLLKDLASVCENNREAP